MIRKSKFLSVSLLISFFIGSGAPARVRHVKSESKWDYSLDLRVTRCFKMKNVKIVCDGDIIDGVTNAELKISAIDGNGKKFIYGYGKSIEGHLCNEHLAKIRALTKKQEQVCMTGDGEFALDDGETFVRWEELETKLGKVIW